MKKIAASLFILGISQAQADSSGFYAGFGLGQSNIDSTISNQTAGVSIDSSASAYKLFAGYEFTDNWSAEVQYADLGDYGITAAAGNAFTFNGTTFALPVNVSANVDLESIGLSGRYKWNVTEKFSPFAKLGVHRITADATVSALGLSVSDSESATGVSYGVGAEYKVSKNVAIRGDLEFLDSSNMSNGSFASVGATFNF